MRLGGGQHIRLARREKMLVDVPQKVLVPAGVVRATRGMNETTQDDEIGRVHLAGVLHGSSWFLQRNEHRPVL